MTSRNASKTGSAAGILVKHQKGTTLKVMPAPNVQGKPFYVLSHQSGNLLTTPRIVTGIEMCDHLNQKQDKTCHGTTP